MTGTFPLSRRAVRFLLHLAERESPVAATRILDTELGDEAHALIDAGFLRPGKPLDFVHVELIDGDIAAPVECDAETGRLLYFHPEAGLLDVDPNELKTWRVDMDALMALCCRDFALPSRSSPLALVSGVLWEIGDVRLPGRARRVPLWIGRRLDDPAVWQSFAEAVRLRPAPGLRIVLNLTPANRLSTQIYQGHEIIHVQDVAGHEGLAIDPDLLAARVASGGNAVNEPIIMAADGAAITVRGKRYSFTGSKQRAIIRQLHAAFQSGVPECLTATVLEEASYSSSVNTLAKAFSGRADWREFIREENGRCWMFL